MIFDVDGIYGHHTKPHPFKLLFFEEFDGMECYYKDNI